MDNLRRLEEIFCKFPGIGPRQAKRFVYYLINRSPSSINEFVKLVLDTKKLSHECASCHRLFLENGSSKNSSSDICQICKDQSRDQNTLLIVARDSDFDSIEKSGAYKGLYFILGGTIPILDKEPEKRIRLETLLNHVQNSSKLLEIILSLNTTPDGENTAEILKKALETVIGSRKIKITFLGKGLSTGSELEYADSETIKNAIEGRK